MERIKKAVEKASEQRNKNYKRIINVDTIPSRNGVVSRSLLQSNDTANISYLETKVLDITSNTWRRNRLIVGDATDEVTSSYKVLRTQVLQKLKLKDWNSFGVTSASSGEGKSLTAVNLAISMARETNHTVLLVDFDMRSPAIHQCFDYEPEYGVGDYLLEGIALNRVMVNPGVERLVVVPGKESYSNSSEILSSPKVVSLVEELKARYKSRIIIFDLPPLLSSDDAIAFLPFVDAVLLVIEEGKTKEPDFRKSLELLDTTKVLGTVMNKCEQGVPTYG